METTLPNSSFVLTDRLAYHQNDPQRGDIIVFSSPLDPEVDLVSRVIGLPGEVVSITQGQVSINGSLIGEPYISSKAVYTEEWNIPQGEYFVLGDKRSDSADSHTWGFLPRINIKGKAVWIYYPFAFFGKIDDVKFQP